MVLFVILKKWIQFLSNALEHTLQILDMMESWCLNTILLMVLKLYNIQFFWYFALRNMISIKTWILKLHFVIIILMCDVVHFLSFTIYTNNEIKFFRYVKYLLLILIMVSCTKYHTWLLYAIILVVSHYINFCKIYSNYYSRSTFNFYKNWMYEYF